MKNYFRGIIGHKAQLRVLENHLQKKDFVQSYLFVGREGLGKREIALRFIGHLLNLESKEKITKHPDVKILDREKVIKIDEIRALKHHLHLQPYWGSYKITFIPEAERMNIPAANSFLKVLEEPPGKSILILTAKSEKSLLPTIVSRCQILKFYSVPEKQIEKFLLQKGVSGQKARLITRFAHGLPGYALTYFQHPDYLEKEMAWAKDLLKLKRNSLSFRFNFGKNNFEREKLEDILKVWFIIYRDIFLLKQGCSDLLTQVISPEEILSLTKKYTTFQVKDIMQLIQRILTLFKYNINKRLALEVLLLNI